MGPSSTDGNLTSEDFKKDRLGEEISTMEQLQCWTTVTGTFGQTLGPTRAEGHPKQCSGHCFSLLSVGFVAVLDCKFGGRVLLNCSDCPEGLCR